MATHSSVLAWRIPGMGEPAGLPSMRSHRVEQPYVFCFSYSWLTGLVSCNCFKFLSNIRGKEVITLRIVLRLDILEVRTLSCKQQIV